MIILSRYQSPFNNIINCSKIVETNLIQNLISMSHAQHWGKKKRKEKKRKEKEMLYTV